jgi:hypothetical protein
MTLDGQDDRTLVQASTARAGIWLPLPRPE